MLEEAHVLLKSLTSVVVSAAVVLASAGGAFASTSPSYPAPGDSLTCSKSTVPTSTIFSCTIGGADGADATLTVTSSGANAFLAGAVSSTKTIASNVATFSVTAPTDAGTLAISSAINGVAADTTTVLVTAGGTIIAFSGPGNGRGLALTGTESTGLALGAAGLLVVGAGVVVFAARRRTKHNA